MKARWVMMTVTAVLALTTAGSALATDVWLGQQRGDLFKCGTDGSSASTLADPGSLRLTSVSITPNYMYVGFGDFGTSSIYQYDLDGSNPTQLASNGVDNDALRATDSYLYFIDSTGHIVSRADLDGSNVTQLYDISYGGAQALCVVNEGGASDGLYWLAENRRIWRSGLDGSSPTELLNNSGDRTLGSIATDGNYIYYTIDGGNTLNRRDMDGANLTVLLTDATAITTSDSLRLLNRRLYWTNGGQNIFSAAADGSESSATLQFNMNTTFGSSSTQEVFIDFPEVIVVPLGTLITVQ